MRKKEQEYCTFKSRLSSRVNNRRNLLVKKTMIEGNFKEICTVERFCAFYFPVRIVEACLESDGFVVSQLCFIIIFQEMLACRLKA